MRSLIIPLAATLALGLSARSGLAVPITYSATLTGAAENPSNASPGIGLAIVTIDLDAHTLTIDVSFSGLLAPSTVAHIHCCTPAPGNIGVATQTPSFPGFPSGVTAGVYFNVFDTTLDSTFSAGFRGLHGGTAGAEAALAAGLAAGEAYFNLHSSMFPGGEIRGFLTPVPEPGTLALLGAGLAGFLATRRRRDARRGPS